MRSTSPDRRTSHATTSGMRRSSHAIGSARAAPADPAAVLGGLSGSPLPADRGVVLVGLPGSGKGGVGACLAGELGRPFVDLDDLVERRTGLRPA